MPMWQAFANRKVSGFESLSSTQPQTPGTRAALRPAGLLSDGLLQYV
jgi:hypothetical protein